MKKAQVHPGIIIIGIFLLFVCLVIISFTGDAVNSVIDHSVAISEAHNDGATAFFVKLIPFGLVVGIFIGVIWFIITGGSSQQ
jgi:hypothetical protein